MEKQKVEKSEVPEDLCWNILGEAVGNGAYYHGTGGLNWGFFFFNLGSIRKINAFRLVREKTISQTTENSFPSGVLYQQL